MDQASNIPNRTLLKFKTVVRNAAGPKQFVTEVLGDSAELDLYRTSCQDPNDAGFKQPIGFPQEVAVAIALGMRPTTGHDIQVIAVVQETGGIVGVQNHILYVVHGPHGPAGDALTYPQHVIRVRGLSGIVQFRQVPDTFASVVAGARAPEPTTLAVGEEGEGHPTTAAVGEEGMTTLMFGEEGGHPTTLLAGEEHPTTSVHGEEGPTFAFGESPTSVFSPWEEGPTTFRFGEEGVPSDPRVEDPFGGQGGGRGPFG